MLCLVLWKQRQKKHWKIDKKQLRLFCVETKERWTRKSRHIDHYLLPLAMINLSHFFVEFCKSYMNMSWFLAVSLWDWFGMRSSVVGFHDMFIKVSENSAKTCDLWNICTYCVGAVSWHKWVIKTVVLCTNLSIWSKFYWNLNMKAKLKPSSESFFWMK